MIIAVAGWEDPNMFHWRRHDYPAAVIALGRLAPCVNLLGAATGFARLTSQRYIFQKGLVREADASASIGRGG